MYINILKTALIIGGLSGLFALLLSLADKYVADYGTVKITINGDKELNVDGGKSLLSSLVEQKLFIPSACGGKGSCGYCKVKVLSGGGPMLSTELPWMSEEDIKEGKRLACQCKVKQPISIEIDPMLLNVKEFETTVESIEIMTPTIKKFRFKLPEGETIKFKPGQYVQLKAPAYEGNKEEVYRAYSVASSIKDSNHIELLIGYTGGIATTYVHYHLKEGDKVNINGPFGDFYYHDDDSDLIFVAAGTGFAPIRSILHHMRDNDIKRSARFYFGAKTPEDLFLVDEMKEFEKELYDFKFMPTLSRVTDDMNWTGDQGRVNASIEKYVDENGNYSAYLCGSPVMIESIVESLLKKKLDESKIYYDKF